MNVLNRDIKQITKTQIKFSIVKTTMWEMKNTLIVINVRWDTLEAKINKLEGIENKSNQKWIREKKDWMKKIYQQISVKCETTSSSQVWGNWLSTVLGNGWQKILKYIMAQSFQCK